MSPLTLRRLSDEKLSSRLASGEAAAFDELYRRYAHRLAAYGGQLLGDGGAGEDVAQVALMNAYQALRGGRVPERVRPWLYRIAHNAAIDALARRRELLRAEVLAEDEADTREQPGVRGALLQALAALPERQRRAYVLRELHGLKMAEIAAELGLGVAQVEQALFAARNRLAELILFGERLSCDAARRLADGPLDWAERRAVKSHARQCPSCRTALAGRASMLGLLPGLGWLRDAAAGLVGGGGSAAAAKVATVAATATLVAGIPASHDPVREVSPPAAHAAVRPGPRKAPAARETHPLPAVRRAVAPASPVASREQASGGGDDALLVTQRKTPEHETRTDPEPEHAEHAGPKAEHRAEPEQHVEDHPSESDKQTNEAHDASGDVPDATVEGELGLDPSGEDPASTDGGSDSLSPEGD